MVASVNSQAGSLLSTSDWMHLREGDGGTAMPADWKTYRTAVRTTANAKETEIDALADLDAVKAYETSPCNIHTIDRNILMQKVLTTYAVHLI